jgi:SAM-dependent methyltransferase
VCGCDSGVAVAEPLDEGSFCVCARCRLQFLDPVRPDLPVFQDFTDYARLLFSKIEDGANVDAHLAPNERFVLRWLQRDLPAGQTVLELCCESGRFLAALRAHGFRPLGLDPLHEPIAFLRSKGFRVSPGLTREIPVNWPEPRAVVLLESMVRFPDPVGLLSQIRRRYPSAPVYVSIPSPRRSLKLPEFDSRLDYPPHQVIRWSAKSIANALREAGYRPKVKVSKVWINRPARRGLFGNLLALGVRALAEGEVSIYARGRPL